MESGNNSFIKKFSMGYTFKVFMLVVLVLLLLIPLNMIRGLVNERGRTAASAESDIMEAWGKELIQAGPVITIPGVRTEDRITRTEKEGEKVEIVKTPFALVISPKKLNIDAVFKTEVRWRGIFSVPLYYGVLTLSGSFDPSVAIAALVPQESITAGQAEMVIALSSQKGIRKINASNWGNDGLFFQPGNRGHNLFSPGFRRAVGSGAYATLSYRGDNQERTYGSTGNGIYAALPRFEGDKETGFNISIEIQGGQLIRVLAHSPGHPCNHFFRLVLPLFPGSFSAQQINDWGIRILRILGY